MPNLPLILVDMNGNSPKSKSLIDSKSKSFNGELRRSSIKCKDTIVRYGQLFSSTFFDDNLYKYTSHVSIALAFQPAFICSKSTIEAPEQSLKPAETDSHIFLEFPSLTLN